MFENLTGRLNTVLKSLQGKSRITADNIADALKEVRKAFLEADVALPVINDFIETIQEQAIGKEILSNLNPGQAFIGVVQKALTTALGAEQAKLNLDVKPPAIILLAGLQGVGKTTTVAKLAYFLKNRMKKKVMLVSADVYRLGAMQQLQDLATEAEVEYFSPKTSIPLEIVREAHTVAKQQMYDVLLVDTAGRLTVDAEMMQEIQVLHAALEPTETLFVVDAMTGQDALLTATAFNKVLPLTGIVLAKADADTRGGAALSVRHVVGKPIKFMGVGEKLDALELFYPERIASRILGMGDVLSLIEETERSLDQEKAKKWQKKFEKGKGFDLYDLRDQLLQIDKMGGLSKIIDKLPGMSAKLKNNRANFDSEFSEARVKKMLAIISSMTPNECRNPDIILGSRKKRIATGSGSNIQYVNQLLKQFKTVQKMMLKMSGNKAQPILSRLRIKSKRRKKNNKSPKRYI